MTDMPERIWAKTHGASTDVISGRRGLIGGWNEHRREGQSQYIRADLHDALQADNKQLREALIRARIWIENGGDRVGPMLRHIDAALKQELGHE